MADWPQKKVIELQRAGWLLVEDGNHGEYRPRPDEFGNGDVAFIRAADMDAGRVLFDSASKINKVARERIIKGIGAGGDVLLSHKGTVGKMALVPLDAPPFVCSPQTTLWRTLNPNKIDRRYLYYFMNSEFFRQQLNARKGETDMADYVSLTAQRELLLELPPIEQQREIARILGTLDDKIELSHRMNRTLEDMARALFKSWFVNFEPVTAKAAARKPFGMNAQTAALFPDHFVESELGPIPKGWSVRRLRDVTSKIGSGATPRGGKQVYVDDGIAFIRSQNVYDHEFCWDGLARITDKAAEDLRGVTVQRNDVLLNITGDSILRTCVVDSAVLPARVSQHVAIIRALEPMTSRYLHLHLVQFETKQFLLGFDAGGTRPAVTKGQLESVPILVPQPPVLAHFDGVTSSIYAKVEANVSQERLLCDTRDLLLPRLLSGEIRLRQAERIAEEVT